MKTGPGFTHEQRLEKEFDRYQKHMEKKYKKQVEKQRRRLFGDAEKSHQDGASSHAPMQNKEQQSKMSKQYEVTRQAQLISARQSKQEDLIPKAVVDRHNMSTA